VVPAGRLAAFWAGIPHQIIEFECLAEYFVLTIPLAWFLQWRLPDRLTQPILHGRMIVEPDKGLLELDRARFEVWSEDLQIGSEERCHASLLEVEARMRRLALTVASDSSGFSGRRSPTVSGKELPGRAEAMSCFIAQNYAQPLTAKTRGRDTIERVRRTPDGGYRHGDFDTPFRRCIM
jgi:hypothetical protein